MPSFKQAPHLVVDARPYTHDRHTGYITYIDSIIGPLLDAGYRVTMIANRPLNPSHPMVQRCESVVFGSAHESIWEQRDVSNYLAKHACDLYFVGLNRGLPWRKAQRTRYILGLLDVIPYRFPRQYFFNLHYLIRELRPVAQLISLLRADELVTISHQSARDIAALFHRPATALWLKLDAQQPPQPSRSRDQFVYVGGVDARKKVGVLISAFAVFHADHPEFHLVLIGRGYEALRQLIAELELTEHVTMTGFVSDEAKMATIAESAALVYPSLYEGYGLAIAEGFIAGVPVIAGSGGSQAEIGGRGVLYINPENAAEITRAMEQCLEPEVRQHLAIERQAQLEKLTGKKVEADIVAFFEGQVRLARTAR